MENANGCEVLATQPVNSNEEDTMNENTNPSNPKSGFNSGATGDTGGTGGPGVQSNQALSFEEMIKKASYESLISATGGIGGIPDSPEEVRKNYSFEKLVQGLKEDTPKVTNEEVLIAKVKQMYLEYETLFEETNSLVAAKAYAVGMFLNQLQAIRASRKQRDWTSWAEKTFPNLKKTRRENMMNIATLPAVEKHFSLGVERLAEFSRFYNNMDEKGKTLLGLDPIATILNKNSVDMTLPVEENRVKIDAVLAHYELAKKKVVVSVNVLEDFFKAGHKITPADRKHMIEISKDNEEAPAKYLEEVIAAGGNRADVFGEVTFKEKAISRILHYETQFTKLIKSLEVGIKNEQIDKSTAVEGFKKIRPLIDKFIQEYDSELNV